MKNWKLVIIPKGDDTTGLYYENGNLVKNVKVRRYYKDEYSPEAAVKAILNCVFGKSEFDWNAFKNHKVSVRLTSPKAYENFMNSCEKEGLRWASGEKPTELLHIISYKENMIIDCNVCEGAKNKITWRYADSGFHPEVPIVDWNSKTKVEDEFKEGDLVEVVKGFMSCPKGLRGHVVTDVGNNLIEVDFHVNYGFTHKCGLGKLLPHSTGYFIDKSHLKKVN